MNGLIEINQSVTLSLTPVSKIVFNGDYYTFHFNTEAEYIFFSKELLFAMKSAVGLVFIENKLVIIKKLVETKAIEIDSPITMVSKPLKYPYGAKISMEYIGEEPTPEDIADKVRLALLRRNNDLSASKAMSILYDKKNYCHDIPYKDAVVLWKYIRMVDHVFEP